MICILYKQQSYLFFLLYPIEKVQLYRFLPQKILGHIIYKIDQAIIKILEVDIKLEILGGQAIKKERAITVIPFVGWTKIIGDYLFKRDIGKYPLNYFDVHSIFYLSSGLSSGAVYGYIMYMAAYGIDVSDLLEVLLVKGYSIGSNILSTAHQAERIKASLSKDELEKKSSCINEIARKKLFYYKSREFKDLCALRLQYIIQM